MADPTLAELEPQTRPLPKSHTRPGDHHDGPFAEDTATPDALQKTGRNLANGNLRHPAASAQRAAAMWKMQKGLGNKFAQHAATRASQDHAKIPASRSANPRDANADAKVAKPGQSAVTEAAAKSAARGPHHGHTVASGTAAHAPAHAGHAAEHGSHNDKQTPSSESGPEAAVALKPAVAPPPSLPDPVFDVAAEPIAAPPLSLPPLDLRLAPGKTSTGQREASAPDPQEEVRNATTAFASLGRTAAQHQRSLLEHANAIGTEVSAAGRDSFAQVDLAVEAAMAGTRQKAQGHRAFLQSASDDALKALERQHHLARVTLGGAAGSARKNMATARAAVDPSLNKIVKDLLDKFQQQFNQKAASIQAKGKEATDHLRSPETQAAVGKAYAGQADMEEVVRTAQAEAQRASVRPLFAQAAEGMDASVKLSVDFYQHKIMTAKQSNGDSITDTVTKFGNALREGAVGADAQHPAPPPPASAEPAKPTKQKHLPLFAQGDHAVEVAFGHAWHAMEEQFKGAKDAVTYARANAIAAVDGQEAAALAQLASIRKGMKESLVGAARSGLQSVGAGTRSAIPGYGDALERSAKTLADAALHGPEALRRVRQEGLAGVEHSMKAGLETQLARLQEIRTGVVATLANQPQQAAQTSAEAAAQIEGSLAAMVDEAAKNLMGATSKQIEGLSGLAKSVSASAASYTKPLDVLFKQSIDDAKQAWFPDEKIKADAKAKPEQSSGPAAEKTPEEKFQEYIDKPKSKIDAQENEVASALTKNVEDRGGRAFRAIDKINMDEDGLLAALRGVTALQGKAVSFYYGKASHGEDLRERLQSEYDRTLGGLNRNEFRAAINYLAGNTSTGAIYELKETVGIFSNDGKRAEAILRDMTPEQRAQLVNRPDWPAVSGRVRDGLSKTDLDVFNALSDNRATRADAIRLKEKVDDARNSDDKDAFAKSLEQYHPTGNTDAERKQNFDDMKKEFAGLTGMLKPGKLPDANRATEVFKSYITRPVTVELYAGDGESIPVTYTVEGADLALAEAIAVDGPGSKNARAARLLREARRTEGKPDLEPLENAVVDPRLNPALNKNLDKDSRKAILVEQDEIYLAYADLARKYGLGSKATTAKEARQEAATYLKGHYDRSSEKGEVGAQYVESIVKDDVPDGALGIRYAILGPGTDEALVHRNFGRMSRKDVDNARASYKSMFHDDMDSDLGTCGKGWFGDLSGDEKLQAEREMMGVPQNDKERIEVALYTIQQQKEATQPGSSGEAYNRDSAQEKAMLTTEGALRTAAGGKIVKDEFGRPTIVGGNFKANGEFAGEGVNRVMADVNMASITAENYSARLDDLSDFVVGSIAIIGAAIATALTAGGASPLLLVAVAAATGAATMLAKQDIRGGRYGWEEAGVDLGMTAVQMLSAGVGASLGGALGKATQIAEMEAAELAAQGGAQAARNAATNAVKINVVRRATDAAITGSATGAIHGFGSTALNERTWEKGIGEGLGNVLVGTVKGSASGAASGAVTGAIDASAWGQKLQGLAVEGGLVKSLGSMVARGVGQSAVSTIGGLVATGTDLAFNASTGKFKGTWHDAMATLQTAGRDAAIRGFFEGGAASVGRRYHNQAEAAAEHKRTEERRSLAAIDLEKKPLSMEVVESLPAGPDGKPGTVEIHLDETGAPVMRVTRSVTVEEQQQALLGFLSAWQAARAEFQGPPTRQAPAVTETPEELVNPQAPARPQQESETPATEAAATRPARIDESAAAGVIGSRATGKAAKEFGLEAVDSATVGHALTSLTGEGGAFEGSALTTGDEGNSITLRTSATGEDGQPLSVRIRVQLVPADSLPAEEDGSVPVAMFEPEGESGYVIRMSRGAPKEAAERALAHEFAEIQAGHTPRRIPAVEGAEVLPARQHALEPGSRIKSLSPHDRGRLAELEVLARKANLETPEGRRALDEAQRLAAHLGLTSHGDEVGDEVAARRELAMAPLSPRARALLTDAIEKAPSNPFLKPLTGSPENVLKVIAERLTAAKETGELSGDPSTWFARQSGSKSFGGSPLAMEAVEQLRQLLADENLVVFNKRRQGTKEPVHGYLGTRGTALRDDFPVEFRAIFAKALGEAAEPLSFKNASGAVSVDASTIAAVRARWGDFENFQDWPAFKANYLAGNPGQEHETQEGEFRTLEGLRNAFQSWSRGRFIQDGSSRSQMLDRPSLKPTPGYEAEYVKPTKAEESAPEHAVLSKMAEIVTRANKEIMLLPTDEAIGHRNWVLSEAAARRIQAQDLEDQAEKLNVTDSESAEALRVRADKLRGEADDLSGQAKPISEAMGVLAGIAVADVLFPDSIAFEFHGSRVPDLIVIKPDGSIAVIECKGGGADLGTRRAVDADGKVDESRRVEQGTREYLESLGTEMKNKGATPEIREIGQRLLNEIRRGDFEYYLIKQEFDAAGQPIRPALSRFDMTPGPKKPPTTITTPPDLPAPASTATPAASIPAAAQEPETEE